MSSIVLELQQNALDQKIPVSELLRKGLVVAKKLKITEFESWINDELKGYTKDIPDYRIVTGQVIAWNSFHGWQPVIISNATHLELLSKRDCCQSIAELESLVGRATEDLFKMPYPPELETQIMKGIGYKTSVALQVDSSNIINPK